MLVAKRVDDDFSNAPQQRAKCGIARQIAAQHHHVHEEADQIGELRPVAPSYECSYRKLALTRVAIEDACPCRQQGVEKRAPSRLARSRIRPDSSADNRISHRCPA